MSNLDAFEHKKPNANEAERAHVEDTPSAELRRLVKARHGTAERAVSEESLDNERKLLREQIDEKRKRANDLEHTRDAEIADRRQSPGLYVLEENKKAARDDKRNSGSIEVNRAAIAMGLDKQIADLRASADIYEDKEEFERVVAARAQFGYADRIYEERKRGERDAGEDLLAA